jgi:ribonucleoside-diphosphate reductase alpha chain
VTRQKTEAPTEAVELPVKRTGGETLEDRLTGNAYHNILPARYLRKNADGEVVESQEELFGRVARNIALAEAVFEARRRDVEVTVTPRQLKRDHPRRDELAEEVFGVGTTADDDVETTLDEHNVNKFAYETVVPELPAEIRSHVEAVADRFETLMSDLSFMPNSPTLMNAGNELQQLSACFVDSPEDDITDIHETAKEAAEVFQSGGGMGYAFWKLRPYGDPVGSTGGIASGPITFMRTFDQMCETIAQGGTRRGAQMGVMRVSHPDVIQFIHAKNKDVSLALSLRLNDPDDYTHNSFAEALEEARELIDGDGKVPKHLRNAAEGHLSNFNISVGVTDGFMEALEAGEEYTFTNPRTGEAHVATEETKELYSMFGLGEWVTVGEELSLPAEVLWDRIVEGAHENGEPGVIYLERVNEEHSFDVEEHPEHRILATNPCGEQPLEEYEACNLGHINLSTVADRGSPDWRVWSEAHVDGDTDPEAAVEAYLEEAIDWDEFDERVEWGTRFLENVVTMSDFPVDKIDQKVREMRKIGLGVMGLAQLYIQLGVRYGSDVGNEIARQLMRHINHRSKEASHELARERGPFAEWDKSKYADPVRYRDWFEKQTGESADDWADGFPIRNHNTTTIAPTGTTSMIANTTGGCEPIYSVAYYKNVSDDVQGDEMLVEFDDYFLRVIEANGVDVDAVKEEAQEQMASNTFDGVQGLDTVPDAIGELFVVTSDLSGKQHAAVQCACQEGVDSAISKTCNFPNDATKEDMEEVYRYIYDHGGKGVTVYRDGTRAKQVLTTRAKNTEFADEDEAAEVIAEQIREVFDGLEGFLEEAPVQEALDVDAIGRQGPLQPSPGNLEPRSRPDVVMGATQKIDTGYGSLYVTINKDEQGLFEVFATIGRSGGYTASFTEALARLVSLALRSGIPVETVITQLEGIRSPKIAFDHGTKVMSVPDGLALALKRYIKGELPDGIQSRVDSFPVDESANGNGAGEAETPDGAADGAAAGEAVQVQTDVEEEKEFAQEDQVQKLVRQGMSPECPDCEALLTLQEGCAKCPSCGFSEC